MVDKKRELAEFASILYYEKEKGQNEIARIMNISRSYVSQLLTYAKNNGVVDIKINVDEKSSRSIRREVKLTEQFPYLKRVYIMSSNSVEFSPFNIGRFAAPYVTEMINKAKCIGVNPGKSVQNLLVSMEAEEIEKGENKRIVQIMGGFYSQADPGYIQPNESVNRLRNIIACIGYYFNSPAIIDDLYLRNSMLKQKDISALMEIWDEIDFALMGIGVADKRSVLFESFDHHVADRILSSNAVGEINMNFFTQDGEIVPLLDDIKMGMGYEQLMQVKNKVIICSANYKAKALVGALRSGLVDTLFINSAVADEIEAILEKGN